jgi:hypothetical protein
MLLGSLLLNGERDISALARQTTNVFERMCGLLGRLVISDCESLWITRCNSIHTCFMRYALDVVFVDKQGVVLKVSANVVPWRLRFCWLAAAALEFRAGAASQLGISVGSHVEFLPNR